MDIPHEPSNIKKQVTKLKNEWTLNTELHYENSAIWFNNQIQKYLWDNWKDNLKERGFNWQKFLKLMSYRTDDALLWIDNRISWKEFVNKIIESAEGHLGDMIVGR